MGRSLKSLAASVATAALTGGFLLAGLSLADAATRPRLAGVLVLGALAGVATLGLVRLFPVARWGWPIAGLLAGPFVVALALRRASEGDGGAWVAGALLGLFVGLLEWARAARADGRERR